MHLNITNPNMFNDAIHNKNIVSGLTHNFYKYPARFSPQFARCIIQNFSKPGDIILDPFVGGGTTLVEGSALGRISIGIDISSLAIFISRVKTTPISHENILQLQKWLSGLLSHLNIHQSSRRPYNWINTGYQKNINAKTTWPIRKCIEQYLQYVEELPLKKQRNFARCVMLRTAQWGLDSRKKIPSISHFRHILINNFNQMINLSLLYGSLVRKSFLNNGFNKEQLAKCYHRSAKGIENIPIFTSYKPPTLILTSPPYPGVHILYHRWQIKGRKETPAPLWIAGCLDGVGDSYYTFGNRKTHCSGKYYLELEAAFTSLSRISNNNTILVQLMGFSEPSLQLAEFLFSMDKAGWEEIKVPRFSNSSDKRIWREVPNRKWYSEAIQTINTSKEVVLFHVKK